MTEGKSRSYFDYRLRLQVSPDSADRLLLEYLKGNQHFTYSEKEMVLAALRMCWLPIAFQHQAGREDLRRIGLEAIMRLREQIRYVAAVTGVDLAIPMIDPLSSEDRSILPRPVRFDTPLPVVANLAEDGYERDLFDD